MALGRIQNRAMLQAAANDLDLEGIKRMPAVLETGDVKVVYLLGGSLTPNVCSLSKNNGGLGESLDGAGGYTVELSGHGIGVTNPFFPNQGFQCELAALSLQVTYDGPGSTADAGAALTLEIYRRTKYGSNDPAPVMRLDNWQQVQANTLSYVFNLGSYFAYGSAGACPHVGSIGNNIIPAGDSLTVHMFRPAAGVFPAGTRIFVSATIFTRECQPQFAWTPGS